MSYIIDGTVDRSVDRTVDPSVNRTVLGGPPWRPLGGPAPPPPRQPLDGPSAAEPNNQTVNFQPYGLQAAQIFATIAGGSFVRRAFRTKIHRMIPCTCRCLSRLLRRALRVSTCCQTSRSALALGLALALATAPELLALSWDRAKSSGTAVNCRFSSLRAMMATNGFAYARHAQKAKYTPPWEEGQVQHVAPPPWEEG